MKGLVLRPLVILLIVSTVFLSYLVLPGEGAVIPAMAQPDIQDQATTSSRDPEANLPYLFAVYAITWVVFFAYLYYLSQRQQNLRREVEELREALSEHSHRCAPGLHVHSMVAHRPPSSHCRDRGHRGAGPIYANAPHGLDVDLHTTLRIPVDGQVLSAKE